MLQSWGLILGASKFPHVGQWGTNAAFLHSARQMKRYMTRPDGLGIANRSIKDLFDSPLDAVEQLGSMRTFLGGMAADDDLVVVYVGHGCFLRNREQDFYLGIRQTAAGAEMATALRFDAIADSLKKCQARVYLILDCCFAA